jgi:putative phosphoribosyl transferase
VRRFRDRLDAGRALALALEEYRGRPDVVVLGLPRGGVPVAAEVAEALGAPLDVFVVRKLGVPGHDEFAMGAIARGGVQVLDRPTIDALSIPQAAIDRVAEREQRELERREREYRGDRPPPPVSGRIAILVDDGLATGASMRAAVAALRKLGPARIVVAVPVGAARTCRTLQDEADEVVCVSAPEDFQAVGLWYDDFGQTSDAEVQTALRDAGQ